MRGTTSTISGGVTSSGLTVSSGETLTVNSGGEIVSATVEDGGSVVVVSGGVQSATTILSGGTETVSGSATSDLIFGALNTVSKVSGVFTSETVASGGTFLLQNGNSAIGTTVLSGGLLVVSGADNEANNTVLSGGTLDLDSPKAVISGSLTFAASGGTLEVSVLADSGDGDQAVASGFTSGDKIDITALASAGTTLSQVVSGGNTVANVISGGSTVESFTFSGTAISGNLALTADSGGDAEIIFSSAAAPVGSTTSVTTSTASGTFTETSGNTLLVLSGGSVSAATIDSGGFLVVSGGADLAATILSGGTETVSAGSAFNDVISGNLVVASGGVESDAIISAGGSATILGSATGDQIFGVLSTVSGGAATLTGETVEASGTFNLFNGDTANNTTVLSGGTFNVSGADLAADNIALSGGGTLDLQSPKAAIGGSLTFSGGDNTLEATAIASSGLGDQAVISGFSTTDKIDVTAIGAAGATLGVVTSGGNNVATITSGSDSESFIFSGTSTYTNVTLQLETDGSGSGGVDLVFNPDAVAFTVGSGTTSAGLTVASGETLTVQSGGTVSATTVQSGGSLVVSGSDHAAIVSAGGAETVFGSATGDQIAGGVTVDGEATHETVLSNGALVVNNGVVSSSTISASGNETVANSGSATGDLIFGSTTVMSATVTSETVESGGVLTLNAGGVDVSTTILAGGTEIISAATGSATVTGDQIFGTVLTVSGDSGVFTNETVFSGGVLNLFNSNDATNTLVLSGGTLNLSGHETATNTTLSGGAVLDLQSPKATLSGSLIFAGGGNTLELTDTTDAGDGDLAVMSGFSSTDKIDLTSAAFVGSALTLSPVSVVSGNTVVDVLSAGSEVETFTFAGTSLGGAATLVSDGNGGEDLEILPVSVTTSVTTSTASGAFTETATNTLLVLSGGSVSAATIDAGGFLTVSGGADFAATILSGGLETVSTGSATGDQIFGSAIVDGGTVTNETVLSGGVLAISGAAFVSNVTLSSGGVVDLASPGAVVSGSLTFAGGGNTLEAGAIATTGNGDQAVISGFSSSDKIDVTGISPAGATLSFATNGNGNEVVTINGTSSSESFIFSTPGATNSSTLSLIKDGTGGVDLILDTTPVVTFTSLGGSTNQATQIVNGTVNTAVDPEAVGSTVSVFEGNTVVGTGTVGANGFFSAKVTFPNDNGTNVLTASDSDAAGNTGVTSQPLTFNVNTTAAAFTPGNLVISISGDGAGSGVVGDNQASPITLEQITTSGAFVSQLVLPQTTTVVNGVTENAISGEFGSSSEGSLQLSADGHSLVIAGYGVNAQTFNEGGAAVFGTTALAQTTSIQGGPFTAVPRVIADINADGVVDTSTALFNVFNENNPRSVATVNGSSFIISGQGLKGDTTQGVFVAQDGASTATSIDDATDTRVAEIVNGQLFVSVNSTQGPTDGTTGILNFGSSVPTSSTTPTMLQGLSNSVVLTAATANTVNSSDIGTSVNLSPESFFFANADTLYVADGGDPKEGGIGDGGLQKWVFDTTTSQWNLAYTLSTGLNLIPNTDSTSNGDTGLIGLTGQVVGNNVELFATTEPLNDLGQTAVVSITDSLGATSVAAGESFTTVLTASPGENIRGISFAPTPFAPTITGTVAGQKTASEAPVAPFSGVTIADQNGNAIDTLTITVGGSGGTLADGAGFHGLATTATTGIYTLSGTAASITSELDALVFTPTAGAPNTSSISTFTLSDLSSAFATPTTDSTTSVVDTDPAVAPTITGTHTTDTTSEAAVKPFSGVTIGDTNSGATDTLTITVGGTGGTLSGAGLSGGAGGVYTITGSAAVVTNDLDALSFAPKAGTPNTSSTSTFTLSDKSSAFATATVNAATSVVDTDPAAPPKITAVTPSVVENGQSTEIGTVSPGIAGAMLSLQQTGGVGTLSLVTVSGVEEVIYTAPKSVSAGMLDNVSYTITDQFGDMATGSNTVPVAPAPDAIDVGHTGGAVNVGNTSSAIDGRAGSENIHAGNGNDVVFAGPNDAINLGNGSDTVLGGSNDTIQAGNGTDNISTGANANIALGNGNDTITAGTGSSVFAGNGRDTVTAGANSTITLGNGNNAITEGAGSSVFAGNGNDTVTAGADSTIILGNGNNTITEGAGSSVFAGNGNDTVTAGANSTVTLGSGNDTVFAGMSEMFTFGNGHDTVAFSAATPAALGAQTISGFSAQHDQIDFNPALFANFAAVLHDATQRGANTIITAAPGDSVTLLNVAMTSLTANNVHT
jgi:autotransporter passenger strand-loop-strand repeat protein